MKYSPHEYQTYATKFLLMHPASAIFLDCGLGKSVITLTALFDLCLDSFLIRKVLVIAPLRVARDTWPTEIKKWDHLRGLSWSLAVGNEIERKAALHQRAFVYIINRENVQWLIEESGLPFDYDMVVVDELSSFKSYQAKRFRALLKVRPGVKRIVGLTGTPSSNGLMDLWAEFRLLDMGQRLGRYITHYRARYFQPDKRNGQVVFSYKPLPGAEEAIYEKISDITISMRATDHLQMPECVMNEVRVEMSERERQIYDTMRSELVVSLGGEEVDAGNAAALGNKLSQMANGAVYGEDKRVFPIHDRKLDALEDLIEAENGKSVLVAVLEEGMKYTPISISPNEAQFLETRKFQINEIARIFRVPPHMVGDLEKSSFSNIEQQSLEFVKYTLDPWVSRWEQNMSRSLLTAEEKTKYFIKFNVEGLLRGDYQSRMNGYAIGRQNGWMSANDIRELENLDRIPTEMGGDLYLINGNMTKLEDAGIFAASSGKEDTTE